MLRKDVLKHPARVLTQAQRERYFADGFLILPEYVPAPWLARLKGALNDLMERSRAVTRSDETWPTLDLRNSGSRSATSRLSRPRRTSGSSGTAST